MLIGFLVMIVILLGVIIYFMNITAEQKEEFTTKAIQKVEKEVEKITRIKVEAKLIKENLDEFLEFRENTKPIPYTFLEGLEFQMTQINYIWSDEFIDDLMKLRSYSGGVSEADYWYEFGSKLDKIDMEINSIKTSLNIFEKHSLEFVPEKWMALSRNFKVQLDKDGVSPLDVEKVTNFKIDFSGSIKDLSCFTNLKCLIVIKNSISYEDLVIIFSLNNIEEILFKTEYLYLGYGAKSKILSKVILRRFEVGMNSFLSLIDLLESGWFYSNLIVLNDVRIEHVNIFLNKIDLDLFRKIELNFREEKYSLDNEIFGTNLSDIFYFTKKPDKIIAKFKGVEFDLYRFNDKFWDDMWVYFYSEG